MTAILVLLILAAAVYVVTALRTLHHDRPRALPVSHPDWGSSTLPSHPFRQDV